MDEEKKLYAVYEVEEMIGGQSEVQMGIFDSVELAINAIIDNNKFNIDDVLDLAYVDEDMPDEDKYQMMDDSISEDLERSWEVCGGELSYYIKEVELNKWDEI